MTADLSMVLKANFGPPDKDAAKWIKLVDTVPQPFDAAPIPHYISLEGRNLVLTTT